MIYLKPLGGLGNRMRAVDSMINLCKKHGEDLTILWLNDGALNAKFEDLFDTPEFREFDLNIVNCPAGFPENYYLSKPVENLKNLVKGRKTDKAQKKIARTIERLPDQKVLVKNTLEKYYASSDHVEHLNMNEMDDLFYEKIDGKLDVFFENKDSSGYISSCYRLSPLENGYSVFVPTTAIRSAIQSTTSKFNHTLGLHIRKSDHATSRKYSTTDKFVAIIERELASDDNATFFLSTDDEETKANLLDQYGEKIIYNEVSGYDRNSTAAVIDAVVDMYCLSATRRLYGSHHSSFSQVAAQIGGIEEITAR